jgi:hypothetical protein
LKPGLYHFGFEVEDVAGLRDVCKELNAATGIDKRPPNREAEYRVHDPDGNPIDLSQHGWPIYASSEKPLAVQERLSGLTPASPMTLNDEWNSTDALLAAQVRPNSGSLADTR